MKRIFSIILALAILAPATGHAYSFLHFSTKNRYPYNRLIPPWAPGYYGPRYLTRQQRQQRQNVISLPQNRPTTLRFQRDIITTSRSPRRLGSQRAARVVEIIYGSAFVIEYPDGQRTGVRILGADAPVPTTGRGGDECFAQQATQILRNRILGREVFLRKEDGYHKDSRGRLVRYVEVGGRDIGGYLIRIGAAFADDDHPHSRQQRYQADELEAQRDGTGIWSGACDYTDNANLFFQVGP